MAKLCILAPNCLVAHIAVGLQLVIFTGLALSTAPSSGVEDRSPVWSEWLKHPVLAGADKNDMLRLFVEENLKPLRLPKNRKEWAVRQEALRRRILATLGLDDLVPPRWDLRIRHLGTLKRDGYTIDKITYDSSPGMAVTALV